MPEWSFEYKVRSFLAMFILLALGCQYLFYVIAIYYNDLESLDRIRKGYLALVYLIMLGYIIWTITW